MLTAQLLSWGSMYGRWFNLAVLVLWLATMSWLLIVKILPSLALGDPPDRIAMLAAQSDEQRVGYEVQWDQERIGCAVVDAARLTSGATMIQSQIRFEDLPIRKMLPAGLFALFGLDDSVPEGLEVYASNRILFHASGRLQRFESQVSLDPSLAAIRVEGLVVGETLVLTIRAGGGTYRIRQPLPANAMVSNGLMPQTRIPGLGAGRRWTVEVYSPIRPHTSPMEILEAEVVGRELISWGGKLEDAWLVVYRGDPGSDPATIGEERAWLWVRDDGVVLKHKISMLDGSLTFVRVPTEQVTQVQRRVQDWSRAVVIPDERADEDSGVPLERSDTDTELEESAEMEQP